MTDFFVGDRLRWYVVQTKSKQETRAELNLRRWNIQTLAPKIREFRCSPSGAASCRVAPLFPNYVFARFDAEVLGKVRLTRGIQRVVGFGEYATPVDDAVIALIQSRTAEDGFVRPTDLQTGDLVEIVDGPLRSLAGVFERHLNAGDRVLILLTTLGAAARVQIARASIRKTAAWVA